MPGLANPLQVRKCLLLMSCSRVAHTWQALPKGGSRVVALRGQRKVAALPYGGVSEQTQLLEAFKTSFAGTLATSGGGGRRYNPIKTIKTSFLGTMNMLGLAKRTRARFLLTSTSEVTTLRRDACHTS